MSCDDEVLQRLYSARGHLDAVVRMVEAERYCIDVIHQIGAVQGALDHTKEIVLDGHLRTCVQDAYRRGDIDEVVGELVSTYAGRHVATNRHCREPGSGDEVATSGDQERRTERAGVNRLDA